MIPIYLTVRYLYGYRVLDDLSLWAVEVLKLCMAEA